MSIVDDPAVSGDHAAAVRGRQLADAARDDRRRRVDQFQVRFRAASIGLKAAFLRIQSNDVDQRRRSTSPSAASARPATPPATSAAAHEPSLQRILNAFQIPVNVGDANGEDTYDLPTPRPAGTPHDEIEMQRLVKAGAGPVVIEPLAIRVQHQDRPGRPLRLLHARHEGRQDRAVRASTSTERTSTNPTWGASFDPGDAAVRASTATFNGSLVRDQRPAARRLQRGRVQHLGHRQQEEGPLLPAEERRRHRRAQRVRLRVRGVQQRLRLQRRRRHHPQRAGRRRAGRRSARRTSTASPRPRPAAPRLRASTRSQLQLQPHPAATTAPITTLPEQRRARQGEAAHPQQRQRSR